MLFVGGLTGSFFQPLALSYALAVLVSMLVALTVTPGAEPASCSRAAARRREPPLVRGLKRGYGGGAVARDPHGPATAYLTVAAVLLMGVVVAPRLGEELFPGFKERDFLDALDHRARHVDPGGAADRHARRARSSAPSPGVRDFGSHIGQAFLGEEIAGANFGENWVSIDPNADYDKTIARLHDVADAASRACTATCRPTCASGSTRCSSATSEPIVVRVFGDDLGVLRRTADRIQQAIADVPGIDGLHTSLQAEVPQIDVRVKLDVARRYGIKPGDVRRAAGTLRRRRGGRRHVPARRVDQRHGLEHARRRATA